MLHRSASPSQPVNRPVTGSYPAMKLRSANTATPLRGNLTRLPGVNTRQNSRQPFSFHFEYIGNYQLCQSNPCKPHQNNGFDVNFKMDLSKFLAK
jgi:hypothetical protein